MRLTVLKKDGSRQPYDRQKIIAGLEQACYKRPITEEKIRAILEATEEDIFRVHEKDVPSVFIGDTVARHLKKLDKIAYIRFASVYRQFADVGELIEEAQGVEETPSCGPEQKELFEDTDKQ